MTSKDLSRELCEICGIKPLYRVEGLETLQTETTLHLIQLARKNSDFEEIDAVPIYPDFEQPENFVMLMELRVDGLSGGTLTLMGILNKEYWLSDRQDYIEFLYKYYIPALTPLRQDELKQKIRETEWVYE